MFGSGVNGIIYAFSEVSGVSKFDTYTGNGSSTGPTITTGFRPGFVMTKRTDSSGNWYINDGTRSPFNPTVPLYADLANAEAGNGIDLLSNGFQIKNADSSQNASGGTYIYMAFKGSYSDHVSPLNDDGSIDSRVKANTSKGFSIVSYEGTGANATVGHGLSAAPEMIIVKNRTGVYHWIIQHASLGATKYLTLSTTDAEATSSAPWNDTAPTSSVFSLGTSSLTNRNANDFIAYCFHSVAGYSKFGTYTGNGSTTGPTITTGFRSGFVMVKSSTSSGTDWLILDGTRSPNNTRNKVLFPNLANAEAGTGYGDMDVTDTGFQIKTNGASSNANGQTYIYMAFAETADAAFNFDASGNKNNFDANNINSNGESETTYDLMKDTPSLVDENAGNFAVINPLVGPSADTISEANLKIATSLSYAAFSHTRATIGVSSGKWYWEVKYDATSATSASAIVGITTDVLNPYSQCIGQGAANVSYGYRDDAYKFSGGSISSYGASYTVGDVIGVALDLDAGTLAFYKNGVAQGTAYSSISGTYFPGISDVNNDSGRNSTFIANFGQRPFAYTPPTGFLKLNTFNLPDSTIEDGSDYFAPVLYTGTGSSRSISVGFQPDWTWWKSRNVGGNPALFDSVRGVGKYLVSNATNAEATVGTSLTSFDSDGYTIGTNTAWNSTGNTFVSWNWKANGTGVSNTAGTITSTVSANPTAGFSVVSWSGNSTNGATIGHGLGTAPNIIFTKCRSHATSWIFGIGGISGFGVNDYFNFQTTGAKSSSSTFYQAYSTNTFQVGVSSADEMNKTGRTYVSYCFAEVLGYSAIGSYTGSGSSTDGPFIYTGFTPRWILAKVASSQINATSWQIYDTARNPNNVIPTYLFGDSNSAESDSASTYFNADILSNGFKLRAANTYGINQSGATYIYMAFAENPFKNSNAR